MLGRNDHFLERYAVEEHFFADLPSGVAAAKCVSWPHIGRRWLKKSCDLCASEIFVGGGIETTKRDGSGATGACSRRAGRVRHSVAVSTRPLLAGIVFCPLLSGWEAQVLHFSLLHGQVVFFARVALCVQVMHKSAPWLSGFDSCRQMTTTSGEKTFKKPHPGLTLERPRHVSGFTA